MASENLVFLLGNAGRDPELKKTSSGMSATQLSLATTYRTKQSEQTEWHRVVLYDRLAEVAAKYIKKGDSVYISGRLHTREYTDKNGQKRYVTEIIASRLQLIGSRKSEENPQESRRRDDVEEADVPF